MCLGCVQVVQLLVDSAVGSGALNFCCFCVATLYCSEATPTTSLGKGQCSRKATSLQCSLQVVQLLVDSTVGSGALNFLHCYFTVIPCLLVLAHACVSFVSPQNKIAERWYKLGMSLPGNTHYITWERSVLSESY